MKKFKKEFEGKESCYKWKNNEIMSVTKEELCISNIDFYNLIFKK